MISTILLVVFGVYSLLSALNASKVASRQEGLAKGLKPDANRDLYQFEFMRNIIGHVSNSFYSDLKTSIYYFEFFLCLIVLLIKHGL